MQARRVSPAGARTTYTRDYETSTDPRARPPPEAHPGAVASYIISTLPSIFPFPFMFNISYYMNEMNNFPIIWLMSNKR